MQPCRLASPTRSQNHPVSQRVHGDPGDTRNGALPSSREGRALCGRDLCPPSTLRLGGKEHHAHPVRPPLPARRRGRPRRQVHASQRRRGRHGRRGHPGPPAPDGALHRARAVR
ncbi:hypothetical protein VTK73DRAFT_4035 [Phialemonium thermophilum]|uniref:Uncharacterized protein n=1 Tax=Phialemonium thermophilum TaxID=223376 RepID=A0ABR3VD53_9PEZI